MTKTAFAAAFGAYALAEIETGGFVDRAQDAERREREALEALIAIRSPHAAGVLGKIEIVSDHLRDQAEAFGRLVDELEACAHDLAAPAADLRHVSDALSVVSRRLERERLDDGFVRLLRSAALDVRSLASALKP